MQLLAFFDVFFFFKQKTAYEMRISDWSSDVCSSDLADSGVGDLRAAEPTDSCPPLVLNGKSPSTVKEWSRTNCGAAFLSQNPRSSICIRLIDRKSVV